MMNYNAAAVEQRMGADISATYRPRPDRISFPFASLSIFISSLSICIFLSCISLRSASLIGLTCQTQWRRLETRTPSRSAPARGLCVSILCLNSDRLQANLASRYRHVVGGGANGPNVYETKHMWRCVFS